MILAHHEQFILALIAGGIICFRWLFPILGKVIIKLSRRLRNIDKKNRKCRECIFFNPNSGTNCDAANHLTFSKDDLVNLCDAFKLK